MTVKSEARREAILQAAAEAFDARGFEAARMDDIARRAGVSKGTLYNYFESKDALLIGLAESVAQMLISRVRQALEARLALRESIEYVIEPILADASGRGIKRVARIVWSEGLHRPDIVAPFYRGRIAKLFAPDSELRRSTFLERLPAPYDKYPMMLLAPLFQGIIAERLGGEALKLDLRDYIRSHFDAVFGCRRGAAEQR